MCAEQNHKVHANRNEPKAWETWAVLYNGGDKFVLRSHHGKYLCAERNGEVVANRDTPQGWETFHVHQV